MLSPSDVILSSVSASLAVTCSDSSSEEDSSLSTSLSAGETGEGIIMCGGRAVGGGGLGPGCDT